MEKRERGGERMHDGGGGEGEIGRGEQNERNGIMVKGRGRGMGRGGERGGAGERGREEDGGRERWG